MNSLGRGADAFGSVPNVWCTRMHHRHPVHAISIWVQFEAGCRLYGLRVIDAPAVVQLSWRWQLQAGEMGIASLVLQPVPDAQSSMMDLLLLLLDGYSSMRVGLSDARTCMCVLMLVWGDAWLLKAGCS